jgi:hypothetical protein
MALKSRTLSKLYCLLENAVTIRSFWALWFGGYAGSRNGILQNKYSMFVS